MHSTQYAGIIRSLRSLILCGSETKITMKSKVLNMFAGKSTEMNTGKKYSGMLSELVKPFEHDFPEGMDIEDIMYFSMNAWNMGCMSFIVPENELMTLLEANPMPGSQGTILKNMIELKRKRFAKYDRFIADFTLEEKGSELVLTVATQEKKAFLEEMINELPEFHSGEADFEEGFINRYAIVIKPIQPFFDWLNALNPEDPVKETSEASVYLLDEGVDDVEQWLRKKFDHFFTMELEDRHTNIKDWPQKRSYKLFRQWFSVDISSMVYDIESYPVSKGTN